jgi:hypothetical protein
MAKKDEETVRSVREAYMRALVAALEAVEKHAKADKKGDDETTARYAAAAGSLMNSTLGHQLAVGSEGLNRTKNDGK